mmetsp:Transcript_57319/g.134101  ORF Transcript_57319/g.134101 Transcript_57319/m.134101 type:complete len:616 (+) Transcript_57319:22-1869(+)
MSAMIHGDLLDLHPPGRNTAPPRPSNEPQRLQPASFEPVAEGIAKALVTQVQLHLDKILALLPSGVSDDVKPPSEASLPLPRWAGPPLWESSCAPDLPGCFPILEDQAVSGEVDDNEAANCVFQSEQSGHGRHIHKDADNFRSASKLSGMSKQSRHSRGPREQAKVKHVARAAMTLDNLGFFNMPGGKDQAASDPDDSDIQSVLPTKRGSFRNETIIPNCATRRTVVHVLPQSVSGAWRRQAAVLAVQMREEMVEEVKMAKNSMSFRGGLWWLRHIVGLRTLSRPQQAYYWSLMSSTLAIVLLSFFCYVRSTEYDDLSNIFIGHFLDISLLISALVGLFAHHFWWKLSDCSLSSGGQDGLLQAHSVAFGYTQPWLVISRDHGKYLFAMWMASCACTTAAAVYQTQSMALLPRIQTVIAGVMSFSCSAGIVCALCMRVVHICLAMRTSLIQYMQELSDEAVSFEGMAQEWNTIQIFVRTLSDGCSYTLAVQVGMIPVLAAGSIFRILWIDRNLIDVLFSVLPFVSVSLMPLFALVTAAGTTQQCEQSPQVANSMLVGEWDNSMAQDLLAFMSRCDVAFFVNDLRVTPQAVMKGTYVLAAVMITVVSSSADRLLSGS